MKILHVVDQISQKVGGGSAVVPYQLAKAQEKMGHDVTIYSTDFRAADQEAPEGVRLVKFKTVFKIGALVFAPGLFFADYDKYDVMHLHNYRTLVNVLVMLGRTLTKPMILQAHGNCAPLKVRMTKPLHTLLWKVLIFKRAWGYIADAPAEVGQYLTEGADSKKIIAIPIGIDMAEFEHLPEREQRDNKTVLYLGRLHYLKGADLLIKAFALLDRHDTRLVIAGIDDGYESVLRKLVMQLGIANRVDYIGGVYGAEKLQAYVDADLYVMPSRYEMWGLTFMEALACGTPVIMTDRCGAAGILPRYCGHVVSFDVNTLANAVNHALNNQAANKDRQRRREWASNYSWDSIAEKILGVYEWAINR